MSMIGYARVSTTSQDNGLETQKVLLEEAGVTKIFHEKITGTSTKQRAALKECLDYLREGDTLVVTKIDRLARSIFDLNQIVDQLKDRGISIRFLKENMTFEANGKPNSLGTLLFNILGSFAQFERDLIVERTTEGRARAKDQGKHMGRKAGFSNKSMQKALEQYRNREENKMSVSDILKLNGIPKATFYVELKKYETKEK
ncbi:TetR family transcriptional regulator [Planomicrobium soli]|uniref:TetR family transcriptional regulator n=1 Tax=Planomicrobium soli TaxID=1176648 RepID=A0A2P8H4M7_9BACL|nr:recombinase family protein [Planomicrobium soli]PSL41153.1 TetR family transcriptional regulator [Planomicrobium soli]